MNTTVVAAVEPITTWLLSDVRVGSICSVDVLDKVVRRGETVQTFLMMLKPARSVQQMTVYFWNFPLAFLYCS